MELATTEMTILATAGKDLPNVPFEIRVRAVLKYFVKV